ncbi:MAG: dihydropteroate synthase [SAR324 cluster bacterium]|uniref:dihydropteroate synthase n=1 Tax=SAR324 cluster bacterium TaxID=2024889 RepID=A0A2A4SV96_9DELT|nr:MAG: dihydropteroate synthase [SAR324 cluster bacterium]
MNFESVHYCVHAVPFHIVTRYLLHTYGWKYQLREEPSLSLLVRYYADSLPDSYLALEKNFPQLCAHQEKSPLGPRFIIAVGLKELAQIIVFAATLRDATLSQDLIPDEKPADFSLRGQIWPRETPKVMGILNITPDSFFDGGKHYPLQDYAAVAEKMIEAGADIIDIGGESTRPGARKVPTHEEIQRLTPVLRQIRTRFNIPISIDTVKPAVANVMFELGADMINDISGLSAGEAMIQTIVKHKGSYCLMHTQGTPETMQQAPHYSDVIAEIYLFFQQSLDQCARLGLSNQQILLDPGIGFGKTLEHNLDILRFLSAYRSLPSLLLLGTSNKSFIGKILNADVDDRLYGSLITQSQGLISGATVFRVHEVRETLDALRMTDQYRGPQS